MSYSLPPIEVEEKELLPRPAIAIEARTNLESMRDVFDGILPELRAFLDEAGIEAAGPPFVRYLDMASDVMQIEGGLPLAEPVIGSGAVHATELPGGRVASAWHRGTYDAIAETHEALGAWLREQGLRPVGMPWEVYWVSPLDTPTVANWRTEVVVPVRETAG